jgi:hypothetical protein
VLPEGAWTYLGRAYYATGRLPEARQALERAFPGPRTTILPNFTWAWWGSERGIGSGESAI